MTVQGMEGAARSRRAFRPRPVRDSGFGGGIPVSVRSQPFGQRRAACLHFRIGVSVFRREPSPDHARPAWIVFMAGDHAEHDWPDEALSIKTFPEETGRASTRRRVGRGSSGVAVRVKFPL